ncbi:MAG TPA: HAD-IA family hydrolase [Rectinemataceae bacterium]|nr:HAD-IA family hydrolase [Rectinemataceae bacterium]
MIKAVVFDFGNVLCKLERGLANAAMAAHTSLSPEEVGLRVWNGSIERDSETGLIDSREHFRRIRVALEAGSAWSYDDFVEEIGRAIVPYPEGEASLQGVAGLGLRCFILSNTNWIHSLKIFGREVLATVPELHALSFKIGAMKPDPRIWLWLLERAGLEARDCLYVDDVEAYCVAARSLGFSALRFHHSGGNLLQAVERLL